MRNNRVNKQQQNGQHYKNLRGHFTWRNKENHMYNVAGMRGIGVKNYPQSPHNLQAKVLSPWISIFVSCILSHPQLHQSQQAIKTSCSDCPPLAVGQKVSSGSKLSTQVCQIVWTYLSLLHPPPSSRSSRKLH